ncbi:imelysin family protein [Simiduia aestuariiviva]|uniref:Putative iron-regulated protein n=1 Tax=Simiduia aestuariiviva TaxID=1510459 RepID=A0A839UX97_9GAMM|nr:imelysin family protein [Simiduia aestuariiviva]MBB3169987.1 putative iron-regulated protein [Simiduia aestuariiviva]
MRTHILALICASLAVVACQEKAAPPASSAPKVTASYTEQVELDDPTRALWEAGLPLLNQSHEQLLGLRLAVQALLKQPDQEQLAKARDQWHQTHDSLQGFSLYFAMADAHPGLFVPLNSLRDRLDGWPIQPGFLDYFDVYSHSGLVNDIAIPVTAKALREAHQQFDPQDRALGLHPIAYLLWGDTGERPASDFARQKPDAKGEDAPKTADMPNNRRRALLGLMVELAIDDLEKLRQAWQAGGNLQQTYLQLNPQQRSEILRIASLYLLEQLLIEQQMQPQLNVAADLDSDFQAHNAYSGRGRNPLAAQLASLHLLAGNAAAADALLNHWTKGASGSWRNQWQAAQRVLSKLPEQGEATETQWVAAIAALQQLAEPLKPVADAP